MLRSEFVLEVIAPKQARMHVLQHGERHEPGSLCGGVRALTARVGRMIVIAGGLALMALLATAGLAAASDPVVTLPDAPLTSPGQTSSLEAPVLLEPSLTGAVTEPLEPGPTGDLEPALTPVLDGLPVDPVPTARTLLAPLTELVADQPPDVRDVVTLVLGPAVQTLRGPSEHADLPTTADQLPSSSHSLAIDRVGTVDSTGIIRPAGDCVRYREHVSASVVVPRIAAGAGGPECSNLITDLNPFAAVLAALAAGGAGAWILALRMPLNPTGIWLATPVPPG